MWLDDVTNNRLKCADVPGIKPQICLIAVTSKNNLSEIQISRPTPHDSLFSLASVVNRIS